MRDEDVEMRDQDMNEAADNPDRLSGIYTAVDAWCEFPTAAKAKYGPIASWDVSEVTDLSTLFYSKTDFNEDLSRWDVSNVKDMEGMFYGATSFDRQFGGAWSASTATKYCIFNNSPGVIAGKAKDANGTVA